MEKFGFPRESIVHQTSTLLTSDKSVIKFSCQLIIPKSAFQEYKIFSIFAMLNGNHVLLDIPRETLLMQDMIKEESEFVFFPSSKQLPQHLFKMTNLASNEVGPICSQIMEQRIDETNESLVLYLWDRVLLSKLDYDAVFLGYKILNANLALKGISTELIQKRPLKGIKDYVILNNELEVIEGFTFSLRGAPINPLLGLVTKNVSTLVSNPKQSFMLHIFAFVTNQQSTENMGTAKSMMAMKDFLQKDYMIQVFNGIQESIFQKVANNWDLTIDEINTTIDVMMAWTSVKTTSMGRFWKSRLINNLVANGLMAFYIKNMRSEDPNNNPTPEALTIGKPLLLDMKRFLNQKLAIVQAYGKL